VATLSIVAVLKPDGQSGTATIVVTPVRTEPKRPLIGCKSVTREVTLTKQAAAPSAPLQGLGLTPSQWTDPWKDLILFVPPAGVQKKIRSKCALTVAQACGAYWGFNKIANAFGPANLDFYSVKVITPPTVKRVVLNADSLLSHIRLNLNDFMDPNRMMFRQWDASEDRLWRSSNPLGAILRLDFYMGWRRMSGNVDDGTVVVSDYSPQRWRVYTVWNLSDHGHPVSGAREWGHAPADGGGFLIYTRGADRLTKSWMLNPVLQNTAYNAQRAVWNVFQQRIVDFVNRNGGKATIGASTDRREDWTVLTGRYGTQQGWLP
jgi:hypothetical protein